MTGPHRSGFVTLVGRPNVGKSTLLNRLVGAKVSIVSDVAQTTRNQVRGVLNLRPGDGGPAQVVFIDTPGIHKPRTLLGRRLNESSLATLAAVDVVCCVIEADAPIGAGDRYVAQAALSSGTPAVLVVNKTDAARPAEVLRQLAQAAESLGDFDAYIPISAATGAQVGDLVGELVARLPEGPAYYPEGVTTDQPDAFLAAELVREQLLHFAREELPHSLAVTVEESDEGPGGLLRVRAVIRVERESQKGIVIGKGGAVLRDAGTAARVGLEALLGRKVHLELFVKVDKDWQRSPAALDRLGY